MLRLLEHVIVIVIILITFFLFIEFFKNKICVNSLEK